MVSPITTTPPVIDLTSIGQFSTSIGPVTFGGDLYLALFANANSLQVVKSTDGGATWARVDDGAGSPIAFGGQTAALFIATGILFVFHGVDSGVGNDAQFSDEQTFLYGTNLFDPVIDVDNGVDLDSVGRSVLRSDESVLTVLSDITNNLIVGQVFSGGSHGAFFTIDGPFSTPPQVVALVVDSSDIAHALYLNNDDGIVYYSTIDLAGSVSGPVAIPDVALTGTTAFADSGNLYFPYSDGSASFCEVATGATSNPATASWANYQVRTPPGGTIDVFPVVINDGSDVLVFWVNKTSGGANGVVYSAKFNGAGFDSPVVFYDSVAYPPTGVAATSLMSFLSIANVAGAFVGVVNMFLADFSFPVFYLSNGGGVFSGYRNRVY